MAAEPRKNRETQLLEIIIGLLERVITLLEAKKNDPKNP